MMTLDGRIAQWLAYLLPGLAAPGSIPGNILVVKIVDNNEGNQQHCLEESEQWLENVDQIQYNLVLASGKLVLKKSHDEFKLNTTYTNQALSQH